MSRHNNQHKYEDLVFKGFYLPESKIEALETRLQKKPTDWRARFQLLGYYSRRQHADKAAAKKLVAIAIWLIDNMPDCGVIKHWGCVDEKIHPTLYAELKQHWLAQIEVSRDNASVVGSAAAYFVRQDKELAEELYNRAIMLEPTTSEWSQELAWFLRRQGPERALDALNAIRDAIGKESDPCRNYYMLDDLAELAFNAGYLDEASEAALKCLSLAFSFGNNWNDGNAVHHSNVILGRIALKKGDIEAAKKHMSLAGDTPGSPQLNSFGPNFSLAEELFAVGEVESVVSYLEACRKFWSSDCERGALERGIGQIRRGEIPNFAHKFAEYGSDGG